MIKLIGNKAKIAVEFKFCEAKVQNRCEYGYARLWVNGGFIGSLYEVIPLNGYFYSGLLNIRQAPLLDKKYQKYNCVERFDYFEKTLSTEYGCDEYDEAECVNIERYRMNFGTVTDMFDLYAY